MRSFIKILALIKPYKFFVGLNIVFNILSVLFSLFSIGMLVPVLDILFKDSEELVLEAPKITELSSTDVLQLLKYHVSTIIMEEGKWSALLLICATLVVMILFKNLFRYLAMVSIAKVRSGVVYDLRKAIFNKSVLLPLSYFSEERKGDLMARMGNDVQEIESSIMNSLEAIFKDPVQLTAFLVTLFIMSAELTLFVFILMPVSGLIIGKIGSSLKRTSRKGQKKIGDLLSMIEETLTGLRVIKAFNAEEVTKERFDKENKRYSVLLLRMLRKRDLASPVSEFLGVLVVAIVLMYGGNLVLNKDLDASIFITYIALFSQLIPPAKSLTSAYYNVQKGVASQERINEVIDADERIYEKKDAKPIGEFKDKITYENVSFAYAQEDVLKHINLTIEKGKTVALVGQSGSGKSTIADLLPRFHDCREGRIAIDGVSIADVKIKTLRNLMGIVNQTPILFNDTVHNNIAFGIEATREDVIEAARIANADEFISQMKNGYDSNIGDGGGKLSGGQRQRISIARAILKNPPIMILDEATSALDTESERLVQEALNKLMENRTSLVIAHRLSTIQSADKIVVLHEGKIIEEGTHDELIADQGTYHKLFEMQSFG